MKKPYITYVRAPLGKNTFLGLPDVYSAEFARGVDQAAAGTCVRARTIPG